MKGGRTCPYDSLTSVISTSMKTASSPAPQSAWNGLSQMPSRPVLTFLTLTTTRNEAVSLCVAVNSMWQGEGIRYKTLFRDETVGALNATNGKGYVRTLRRAMDLGGFHQAAFTGRITNSERTSQATATWSESRE